METGEKVAMETLGHSEQTGVPFCVVTRLSLWFLSGVSVGVSIWITLEAFTGTQQRSFKGNSFKLNGFGSTENSSLYSITFIHAQQQINLSHLPSEKLWISALLSVLIVTASKLCTCSSWTMNWFYLHQALILYYWSRKFW